MKRNRSIIASILLVLLCLSMGTSTSAGGLKEVHIIPLQNSGQGGVSFISQSIDSGPYFESCGKITYKIDHEVNFGAYNSTSFRFNTTYFTISGISGTESVKGGVGFTGNYENSAHNKFDYKYNGTRLTNKKYSYVWNRTLPLGPANKNAHYDSTTTSGFTNQQILCNNEDNIIMDVGGRSASLVKDVSTPLNFVQNSDKVSSYVGEEYKLNSKTYSQDAIVNQFENGENILTLTQQNDNPIFINNVDENDFVSFNTTNGFEYELAEFKNAEEETLTVVRFKTNGVYMALVSNLPLEEILKIAENL